MYVKTEIIIGMPDGQQRYCTLAQFCRDNAADPELVLEVRSMMDYESITIGGGAAPAFTITRWR